MLANMHILASLFFITIVFGAMSSAVGPVPEFPAHIQDHLEAGGRDRNFMCVRHNCNEECPIQCNLTPRTQNGIASSFCVPARQWKNDDRCTNCHCKREQKT